MKKILFVVDEQKMGGVSILLKDMIKVIDKKENSITVLTLHNNGDSLEDLGSDAKLIYGTKFFEVIDLPLKEVLQSHSISKILKKVYLVFLMKTGLISSKIKKERKKIFERDDFDIEIAFKDGFTALFTIYGPSKKKLHWLHYEYKKCNANGNYYHLFNKILPKYDNIIAVSEGVMNDFNSIYHLEDKTLVIENLVPEDKIITKSRETVSLSLPTNRINIISVGRLHIQKGYDRLIIAMANLSKKDQAKINIDIYGDGPEKEHLSNLINENKIKNITLKGRVDNPYKYLKKYDLFIMPSLYEPFGLVIVEALTLHVPVLACENSATGKLINHELNGYITPNSVEGITAGLKYIANNPDKIKEYKKNLKNYHYDNTEIIQKINNILK